MLSTKHKYFYFTKSFNQLTSLAGKKLEDDRVKIWKLWGNDQFDTRYIDQNDKIAKLQWDFLTSKLKQLANHLRENGQNLFLSKFIRIFLGSFQNAFIKYQIESWGIEIQQFEDLLELQNILKQSSSETL
jgi:hypothetical protein